MHLLDAQKCRDHHQNLETHVIRVLVPKTHYVQPSTELPNVHALHHTSEILTTQDADLNVCSIQTVQVRWPVSINIVGILVQECVDQTLSVLWPIISQYVNAVVDSLVILSAVAVGKYHNKCHLLTHVPSVRPIVYAELCKVVQRAPVQKDTEELHQPAGRNVQVMKNVLTIRAVST